MPAGVAPSRASSQKSPTFGGSSGSSGVTGTYAGRAPGASSKPGEEEPEPAHDSSGDPAGGSVLDITLHLAASIRIGRPPRGTGHGASIRPLHARLTQRGEPSI